MGQAINKMVSVTLREVKSYNLERRAEKIISKDKPTVAPKYPSTVKELERLDEENASTEYLHKKDEQLDTFLKKVYVSTPDPAPPLERKINPDRPLPLKRSTDVGISFGYSESEEAVVPEGKVSLKQALSFIDNHQKDPKKYSSAAIASQYKISLADSNDILDHFKMLTVRVQKKEVDPASLSTYERLQLKIKEMNIANAPSVMREVNELFKNREENDHVPKNPDDKDVLLKDTTKISIKKLEKTVEKRDSKTSDNDQQLEIQENPKVKESVKHDETEKKGSMRKQSQENR